MRYVDKETDELVSVSRDYKVKILWWWFTYVEYSSYSNHEHHSIVLKKTFLKKFKKYDIKNPVDF